MRKDDINSENAEAQPRVSGWGRLFHPGREMNSHDLITASADAVLFRGLARSYGDSSLTPDGNMVVVATPLADRILSFNRKTGALRAEAGLSLSDLNRTFWPQNWTVPVTPGTQFVTLGGMVASDVHGKGHHRDGCFGDHVTGLRMRVADGRIIDCSPESESDLFWATVGGMGLTGHILEVEFIMRKIPTAWIYQETTRIPDIDTFIAALINAADKWPFTVGWIDTLADGNKLGRGLLTVGRWATADEAPAKPPSPKKRIAIPFVAPGWLLNRLSVRAFNALVYRKQLRNHSAGVVHPDSFFYPLDAIENWNRMYGPRGFTQLQCVLPEHDKPGSVRLFLETLTSTRATSFLSVIKDCGPEGRGMLSFPMRGISVALDLPVRDDTQAIVDELNKVVISTGGRIYLTKDAFTRAEDFRAMEHRLDDWLVVRKKWNPDGKIRSAQSVRLFGDIE